MWFGTSIVSWFIVWIQQHLNIYLFSCSPFRNNTSVFRMQFATSTVGSFIWFIHLLSHLLSYVFCLFLVIGFIKFGPKVRVKWNFVHVFMDDRRWILMILVIHPLWRLEAATVSPKPMRWLFISCPVNSEVTALHEGVKASLLWMPISPMESWALGLDCLGEGKLPNSRADIRCSWGVGLRITYCQTEC